MSALWRFLYTLLVTGGCWLLLGGCSQPPPVPTGIADLERLPQDVTVYLSPSSADRVLFDPFAQARRDAEYNRRFFAPWHKSAVTLGAAQAFWGVEDYGGKQGYAENLQPYTQAEWLQMVVSLQQERYPALFRPAITVRNSACRVFPTHHPFFLDPQRPGEGFPFDYFQNSMVWAGTPLLVTHVSADGAWYFAEAGYVFGWFPADALAWADPLFRSRYETGQYAALLRDAVTLRDEQGGFLLQSHLGAIFPLAEEREAAAVLLVPARQADGSAVLRQAICPSGDAVRKPLPVTAQQLAGLANVMIGERYGWGGLYENRDCSATLRDLFAPFGLWLPRNSRAQAAASGTLRNVDGLNAQQKRELLLQEGLPFFTLIWLHGHIGLYLGSDPVSGEPLLLHNLWGVRTRPAAGTEEGRLVVGRLVVTTMRPGEERPDVAADWFYRRFLGFSQVAAP